VHSLSGHWTSVEWVVLDDRATHTFPKPTQDFS
jgi:hypothetical protein